MATRSVSAVGGAVAMLGVAALDTTAIGVYLAARWVGVLLLIGIALLVGSQMRRHDQG